MFDFEKTRLWRGSLGRTTTRHTHRKERERLRAAFFSFRKNAALLAGEIPRDFDFLSVHDITHLDALWEMADLVTAKNELLSPLEAFVLGGAFLIHDLGMGLAAYPDGFDGVRQRSEFRDLITVLLTAKLGRRPSVEELQHPDGAITNEAKFSLLETYTPRVQKNSCSQVGRTRRLAGATTFWTILNCATAWVQQLAGLLIATGGLSLS
jgi:hypothetical protein